MGDVRTLRIGWLYPTRMNIYGDRGNIIALKRRAFWRNIESEVIELDIGDAIPDDIDLFFFGGGQDQEQTAIASDLLEKKADSVRKAIGNGAAALTVCGGYQLFGKSYRPNDADELPGIGVFDVESTAGDERFIGNVLVQSEWGELVGFENHSGLTWLGPDVQPLGRVVVGRGNNGQDGTEGARYRNALGCYLHGSVLPKNPVLTDWLIARGLEYRGQSAELVPLDDSIEQRAHRSATERARSEQRDEPRTSLVARIAARTPFARS